MRDRLRQWWCRVSTGHNDVPVIGDKVIRLTCLTCGWQSPGWQTGGRPPRRTYPGLPTRAHRHLRLIRRTA